MAEYKEIEISKTRRFTDTQEVEDFFLKVEGQDAEEVLSTYKHLRGELNKMLKEVDNANNG